MELSFSRNEWIIHLEEELLALFSQPFSMPLKNNHHCNGVEHSPKCSNRHFFICFMNNFKGFCDTTSHSIRYASSIDCYLIRISGRNMYHLLSASIVHLSPSYSKCSINFISIGFLPIAHTHRTMNSIKRLSVYNERIEISSLLKMKC